VVIFGTSDKVQSVAADFCARGFDCHGLKVDLANEDERVAGFAKAVELLGGLDILINAAGIQRRHPWDGTSRSTALPRAIWIRR
jgi:2-deoxy-D-gluconate 3-dehydrogenase